MGYLDENGLQRYHSGVKTALANKADLDDIVALPNQAGTYILKAVSQNGTITYTWDTTKLTMLRYGSSTWADFIEAYSTNSVVYCRASSNTNPATGAQNRLAFMAYVNDATNPTNVEFQYYRSVNQHSATQQGDQVYVYKLDKTSGWTITVRESYTKVVAGTKMSSTWANGAITLDFNGHDLPSGGTTGQVLKKTSGTDYAVGWADDDTGHDVPSGGTTGQVLQKKTNTDYDVEWGTVASGGDVMVVNISSSQGGYIADKTFSEILAAINNGKCIIACHIGNCYYLRDYTNAEITLIRMTVSYVNVVGHYMTIKNDNRVSIYNTEYAVVPDESIIDIYYDDLDERYMTNNFDHSFNFSNYFLTDDQRNLTVRIVNLNDSQGLYMNGGEVFYLADTAWDANYEYDLYDDPSQPDEGGYIFTFKNMSKTKTLTMKVGRQYSEFYEYNGYLDVTVTNESGGGGGDVMVVTVTKTGNVYYADKTYSEIQSAVNNNKFVYCYCLGAEYYLISLVDQYALFQTLPDPQTYGVYSYTITITNNNAISRASRNYTTPSNVPHECIIDIYRESLSDPYSVYFYDGNFNFYNILTADGYNPCLIFIRLFNYLATSGYYMDGGECFYLNNVAYEPNTPYDYYGETETGVIALTFKNFGTKTIVMKIGMNYNSFADAFEASGYDAISITVTT